MKKFLQKESVSAIFRAILSRPPSPKEAYQLESQLLVHGNLEAIARDLLLSEEFSIQILPQLVARWSKTYGGKKVFFLHVPKTAGTSVRLALGKAIGLPSINFYAEHQPPPPGSFFWPYLAGHVGVAAIPESHVGFTVFREPRSRLLSMYRQRQFLQVRGPAVISLGPEFMRSEWNQKLKEPWQVWSSNWLRLWFHFDTLGRLANSANSRFKWLTQESLIKSMSRHELEDGLRLGLSRIKSAAWIHDASAVIEAIARVTSVRIDELPRENSAEKNLSYIEHKRLSERDLEALELATKMDQGVIDLAVKQGLIPALDTELADKIFEETLRRLNFSLP